MVDLDSEQTLYAKKPNQPLPPASTAKLMTALVTVKRANVDDRVTVSASQGRHARKPDGIGLR